MRRFFVAALTVLISSVAVAQTDTAATVMDTAVRPRRIQQLEARSNDHFLLQFGYTQWHGKPDTVNMGGIPRTFNVYFMFDFPFKTNPSWSVGIGVGMATDNIYFEKSSVGIANQTEAVVFRNLQDTNHFKKYKLATAYAEAPIELRFSSNPADNGRSVKAALGIKVGRLLNVHTKGKELENRAGNTLNNYKEKLYSRQFFNDNRLSATARLGYGHFSIFASYSLTPLFREGLGPAVRPMSLGLTLSGL